MENRTTLRWGAQEVGRLTRLIKNMLDIRRIEIGAIKPEEMEGGLTYYGHLNLPGVDIYGYDEVYLDDETNETKPLIPDNVVLMLPSAARYMRAYGQCT